MYKGPLHIKCEVCGDIEQYFQPENTDVHICRKCGEYTELKGLRKVNVNCECGYNGGYLTNIEEELWDIRCRNCGQPVTVSYNKKKNKFFSVNRTYNKHGKQ